MLGSSGRRTATSGRYERRARVAHFFFGSPTTHATYGFVEQMDTDGLLLSGDIAIVSTGIAFSFPEVIGQERVLPNYTHLAEAVTWLGERSVPMKGIIRTSGKDNVSDIADWINDPVFPERSVFDGICITYEKSQGDFEYVDPEVDADLAPIAMLENHQINRNTCTAAGLEFWSIPGGRNLQTFIWELVEMPYGQCGAICDGFMPQFQADLKDGDLLGAEPNSYSRMKGQLQAAGYPKLLLPQALSIGTGLGNGIEDTSLALQGVNFVLENGAKGFLLQNDVDVDYATWIKPFMQQLPFRD